MKYLMALLLLVSGLMFTSAYAAEELEPGLVGEYFNIGQELSDFPAIPADQKPAVRKIDKQIAIESTEEGFNGTNLIDYFYIRWTGKIKIEKAGKYTFTLESDDGSRLFIDGKQVIDNNGLHAMQEVSSEPVDLAAGTHDLKIDYFDNTGGAGCKFSWAGPDIAKQIVPAAVLFHAKGGEKETVTKP